MTHFLRSALFSCLLLPLLAQAHKPSDAYLQLQVDGSHVEQRFDIALRDLERELALDTNDNGQLEWREVRTRWDDIAQLAQTGLSLNADGQPCTGGPLGAPQLDEHSDGRYVVLTRRWTCAAEVRQLDVGYTLFAQADPTHRGVVRVQHGTQSEPAVLVPGAGTHRFAVASADDAPAGFIGFVLEGMHHILIGTDHILFLLALLLPAVLVRTPSRGWQAAPRLRPVLMDVLRVVTAFTVAHSITLALAAFDVVNPPSRWVESIIAASVVLAALNNLYPVVRDGRWKLTFGFGLVHGFGFASALKDLGLKQGALALPLFGFNLGVELGQLSIVAIFFALVWTLRDTRAYRGAGLRAGSMAITVLAMGWLVERAFDLKLPWLS
ncbi:MAG: HupE/UreJ family protein [Rhizobacter sp.]